MADSHENTESSVSAHETAHRVSSEDEAKIRRLQSNIRSWEWQLGEIERDIHDEARDEIKSLRRGPAWPDTATLLAVCGAPGNWWPVEP